MAIGWHRLAPLVLAFLVAAAACGPDERAVAEHEEVCDEPSPFRILETDRDRTLGSVQQFGHEDGRRTIRIGYVDEEPEAEPSIFGSGPTIEEYELWSVGSCGELPQRTMSAPSLLRTIFHWPDLMFECDPETGRLEIVDLHGERPRNLVFTTNDCDFHQTQWGLVEIRPHDDDLGALVLLPFPEDPWTQTSTPQTLLDPIRIRAAPPHTFPTEHEVLEILDDELFAITPENDLVRLSLLDGSTTTEATGVREFEISRDLEWLIWQDVAPIGDDTEWPPGAIYLRNRVSGTTHQLADAALAATTWGNLIYAEQGIAVLQLGYLYKKPERLYRLADLTSFDLPLGVTVHLSIPDGRLLVGDVFHRGKFALLDPVVGTATEIFDAVADVQLVEDGFEFHEDVVCCIHDDARAQGPLWSVAFDGAREPIAHAATRGYDYLSDGRLLTTLDIDEDWRGDLIVVDDDLEERVVDDHVLMLSPDVDDDDTLVYGVADGDRAGVWLARLAP